MLTSKELEEFKKHSDATRVEDLYTPDMPELQFPAWLPKDVGQALQEYVDSVSSQKFHEMRLFVDMWPAFVRYAQTVLPAFTEPSMREIWEELYDLSPSKTVRFASDLIMMENEFEGVITLFYKQKNEKECCERMIKKARELHDIMEEYHCHYYGQMLQDNHHTIMETLKTFCEDTQSELDEFKARTVDASYLHSEIFPITREYKSEKAAPIFFARKISLFFQEEFGKPKHRAVAEIINVMFGVDYDDNEIIKITKKVRPPKKVTTQPQK